MRLKKEYDFVCVVSNDLSTEKRMKRCCKVISSEIGTVLLLGRVHEDSKDLVLKDFDQDRIQCFFNSGPLFYFELILRFVFYLRRINFKNLICVDLDTALVSLFFNNRKKGMIIDLHEYFEEVPELENRNFTKSIWSSIGRLTIKKFHLHYTVNETLANIFSKKYNQDFKYVRNIPAKRMLKKKTKSKDVLSLVYLGVLNPGRGLHLICESVLKLEGVLLHLVGDGPLNFELRKRYEDEDSIIFHGHMDEMGSDRILEECHLGLNLLDSKSKSYFFSLGNKFFQYINAGLPVITMNFPEYKDIIHQYPCGLLLDDLDSHTFVNTIRNIQLKPSIIDEMSEECIKVQAHYNWTNEREKLEQIYTNDLIK